MLACICGGILEFWIVAAVLPILGVAATEAWNRWRHRCHCRQRCCDFLSDAEYAAIPLNVAAMIVEAMRCGEIQLTRNGEPLGRERDWLCGILAANADLLTVPWKESRLNEERASA